MKQYLLSVHGAADDEMPADFDIETVFADVDGSTQEMMEKGAWVFGGGLEPADTATVVHGRRRRDRHHRRPVPRVEGAHRRLLDHQAPTTSTPPWRGPARRPSPAAARSRCVRSRTSPRPDGRERRTKRSARVFREEYGRVVAGLVRLLGDIDLAEESVQEAFVVATQRWPETGHAAQPGRLDHRHRPQPRPRSAAPRVDTRPSRATSDHDRPTRDDHDFVDEPIGDDRLRLMFTCCHPALASDAQVALTLRLLGGLHASEIARAYLVPEATMRQRITRAKRKISANNIPYRVPEAAELPDRAGGRAGGAVPRLQRGLHRHRRRRVRPRRPVSRGDPARHGSSSA